MIDNRIVLTIVAKELRETLRDQRALLAMVGIPVLLYPVLILVAAQTLSLRAARLEETPSRVAVFARAPGPVPGWLSGIEGVHLTASADPYADLRAGALDAVVSVADDAAATLSAGGTALLQVAYDSEELGSVEALRRIESGLGRRNQALLGQRLLDAGLPAEFAQPLRLDPENVATARKRAGSLLGRILPVFLILMLGVGAFYPAIDLTAGEKERGTYETLLSTPVSRTEIVGGKFLTILCLAILTSLLNLGSMVVSLRFSLSEAAAGAAGQPAGLSLEALSASTVGIILLVLLPLAFFICAVMMSIALLARDFKEAQNLVTPFFLIILLPAVYAAMPGTTLTRASAVVPIANVALLFKGLLVAESSIELTFAVFLCTAVYALLALVVAVSLFQSEQVILAEDTGIPLSLRRATIAPRPTPTASLSLLLFAFMLLMSFYPGTYAQSRHLIGGLLLTQWGLYLLPTLLLLWYARIDLGRTLRLRRPRAAAVGAACLVGAGTLVLVIQVGVWQTRVLPMPEALAEQMRHLLSAEAAPGGLPVLLLAAALSPAVCEEVLFRGAIMAGIRTRLSPMWTIAVVGLLFGLFHVSIYRVLPAALSGMAIAYLVLRSGSLYVGIGVHLFVNTTSILAENGRLPASVASFLELHRVETEGFGLWLVAAAAAAVVVGAALMERWGRRRDPATSGPEP